MSKSKDGSFSTAEVDKTPAEVPDAPKVITPDAPKDPFVLPPTDVQTSNGFKLVNLSIGLVINGRPYGPGECFVPEDAFELWGPNQVKE